nr:MAG TPA: hypothetical protein [Caudoviricetes sp.]
MKGRCQPVEDVTRGTFTALKPKARRRARATFPCRSNGKPGCDAEHMFLT